MLPDPETEGSRFEGEAAAERRAEIARLGSGGESLLDVGEPGNPSEQAPGGIGGRALEDAEAPDHIAGDSDPESDPQDSAEDGTEVSRRGRPKGAARKITRADCARALELADGNYDIAAAALGISAGALRSRVYKSQQLAAMFAQQPGVPTATSVITRNETPIPIGDETLGEATAIQNRILLREGLLKVGIKPATVEKLKILEELAPNAGMFLVASLDLTHRMMVLQGVRLFEEAERIKTDYLDDATLDDDIKIQWQGAYNDICDQIGKCFDRTLMGTQAMAKLLGTDKGEEKKKKPGFTPLKRAEKT